MLRDILTGLAIVVILLLTAALIGPHVVDWTNHRRLVEKRLSELVGMQVSSAGDIAISLLPTPTISLKDVTFGEPEASIVRVKALDATLSLTSLLRGEIRVTSAALDEPIATLVPAVDGGFAGFWSKGGPISPADVVVERLIVSDGKVSLLRSGRQSLEASRIYVDAEATSLLGPFRGKSRFTTEGSARNFSFATGKYEAGKLRLKALLEDEVRAVRYDLDGTAALGDAKGPVFSGLLAASGNIALPRQEGYGQMLWHLQAPAIANLENIHLDNIDLTLGNDAGVKLTGVADMEFGNNSALNVTLSTKQVDLDRILSPDPKAVTDHRPSEVITLLTTILGASGPAAGPEQISQKPMPVRFDLSVGNVVIGGDSLTGLSVKGLFADGEIILDRLAGSLPGRAEIDVRGTIAPMAGPRFDGQIGLDMRDARRFLAWYGGPAEFPIKIAKGQARVSIAPGSMILGVTDAQLDDGRISAILERKVPSDASQPPILTATVKGSGLPLELARLLQGDATRTDLDLKLDLTDIRVGNLSAGGAKAHVVRTRAGLVLDDIDVQNLAGLQLKGRSSLGQAGGGLLAEIDVRSFDSVVDMLQRVGYPNLARALMRRSAALNGIRATIKGDSRVEGGRFANTLQIDGRVGKTALSAVTQWATPRTASGNALDADINLHMSLQSPDSAELLAQLGFETLRINAGAGTLNIDAAGQLLKGFSVKAAGTIAGAKIVIDGRASPADGFKPFDGSISFETADLSMPARALAIAFPPVPQGMPVKLTSKATFAGAKLTLSSLESSFGANHLQGEIAFDMAQNGRIAGQLKADGIDAQLLSSIVLGVDAQLIRGGVWSRQAFGPAQPPLLTGDIWINTPRLQIADDVMPMRSSFIYRFENGLASFEQVEMQTPSGWLKGNLTLRRTGAIVSTDMHLAMNGLKLPFGNGGLSGQISGEMAVFGSGDSPAAMIGSLAGGGTLQHTGISVARLDPEALARTLAATVPPNANTEPDAVADLFERETGKGALSLPSGEAVLTLAQGTLRVSQQRMPTDGGEVALTLAADIGRRRTDAKAEYQLAKSPDKWTGRPPAATVSWSGSLLLPERRSDATVLSNGLAAIAIGRDLERIQIYEQDARERASFIRRQRAFDQERRRVDEARKAEEDAQREAARRADEEAKRIMEQQRRALEEEKRRADEEAKRLVEQQRRLIDDERRRAEDVRRTEEAARREAARRIEQQMQPNLAPTLTTPPLDLSPPAVSQP